MHKNQRMMYHFPPRHRKKRSIMQFGALITLESCHELFFTPQVKPPCKTSDYRQAILSLMDIHDKARLTNSESLVIKQAANSIMGSQHPRYMKCFLTSVSLLRSTTLSTEFKSNPDRLPSHHHRIIDPALLSHWAQLTISKQHGASQWLAFYNWNVALANYSKY